MTLTTRQKNPEPSVIDKKKRAPSIPTVYDFKRFMGYAGQYGRDPLDSWPTATD